MQITSRLTIAVHTLLLIERFCGERKVTSDLIAASVQVNPVVIRRILLQLKKAGMIRIARGSGGASLCVPADQITLLDICRAVDCLGEAGMFRFHENPNRDCPVGRRIHAVLDGRLAAAQAAFEASLASVSLYMLADEL